MRHHRLAPLGLLATVTLSVLAALFARGAGDSSPRTAHAFTPPESGLYLALDCAPLVPGIQDSCTYAWNTYEYIDVAVVFGNVDVADVGVDAFNFEATGNLGFITPLPATGDPLNSNPDFNESAFTPGFACAPPPPNPDSDTNPNNVVSFLACYTGGFGVSVPPGTQLTLGTVHYFSPGAPLSQFYSVALANVNIFHSTGEFPLEELSCNPVTDTAGPCYGADLNLLTHVFPTATYTSTAGPSPTPTPPDTDGDWIRDPDDNCPLDYNPSQDNHDGFIDLPATKPYDDMTHPISDGLGDQCDADDDNDGRTDGDEAAGTGCGVFTTPTDPLAADSDNDYALDGAECTLGFDPANGTAGNRPSPAQCGTTSDADGDNLPAYREFCQYGTSGGSADSDGDGCGDGRELASINADLQVSAVDLSQVAQAFGPATSPMYITDFDFTRDGTISAIDLSQVAQRFGPCP